MNVRSHTTHNVSVLFLFFVGGLPSGSQWRDSASCSPEHDAGSSAGFSATTLAAMLRPTILALALFSAAAPSAAAAVVFARGNWAAITADRQCEAGARAILQAPKGRVQAHAGFLFDAGGPRHGELALRLSRVPRAGSSIILTIGERPFLLANRGDWAWSRGPAQEAAIIAELRVAGSMRVVARDRLGRRFTDRYLLDGAPGAIDAAAAACAGKTRRS
jgi:hypothetical protein